MERATKRVKTHDFENDEEAEFYLDALLLGDPFLPVDIWVKILSENSELSVQDIQRMCRVNSKFKQMCDTGLIWDKIFIRQFGNATFDRVSKFTSVVDGKHISLRRLIAYRIVTNIDNVPWTMKRGLVVYGYKYYSMSLEIHKYDYYRIDVTVQRVKDPNIVKKYYDIVFDDINYGIGYFMEDISRVIRKSMRSHEIEWNAWDGEEYWEGYTILGNHRNPMRQTKLLMRLLGDGWIYNPEEGDKKNIYTGTPILCFTCNSIARYACGKCQKQFYCGQECAEKEWKRHQHKTCSK